jgi:hypothetical protein
MEEAEAHVRTQVVCSAATTPAQRIQVHEFFVFYSRYAESPPSFVSPPGLGDPTVGGVMDLGYQSPDGFFEFLNACSGIAWGPQIETRLSMRAGGAGGGWSPYHEANF